MAFDENTLASITGSVINNTSDFITGYVCDMIDDNTYLTTEQKEEAKTNFLNNPPKNNPMFYKLTYNLLSDLFSELTYQLTHKCYVTVTGYDYYINIKT